MWELDYKESWVPRNWCFWTVVLEMTLESPLDCKEIQTVHSEGDQPWDFFGRNDAKAEAPVLWPPDAKNWLTGKDLDAGKDWWQEEKGMTGWNGWMESLTLWTWVWVSSGGRWWTAKPGMLQSLVSERARHNWGNELNRKTATAKSTKRLQSYPTLCNPIDSSPLGSSVPGILQARILEWVAISFSNAWKWKVKVKSLRCVRLFCNPMDYSLPSSSVHGIFQARVLEWVSIAFSMAFSGNSLILLKCSFNFFKN